jgi:uncharacterized protein (DUF433 family)
MSATIIDRGRGPEIQGTRTTVYRIMDFLGESLDREAVAKELLLTREQVDAALAYIDANKAELMVEYERILNRPRANPEWVEAGRAKSVEELKQRIMSRRKDDPAHADPCG